MAACSGTFQRTITTVMGGHYESVCYYRYCIVAADGHHSDWLHTIVLTVTPGGFFHAGHGAPACAEFLCVSGSSLIGGNHDLHHRQPRRRRRQTHTMSYPVQRSVCAHIRGQETRP